MVKAMDLHAANLGPTPANTHTNNCWRQKGHLANICASKSPTCLGRHMTLEQGNHWHEIWMLMPCAGSRVVRVDPLHFLAGFCKRRLNQILSLLYLSMFLLCCCLLGPLLCIVNLHWYVFCLLVVLVKLSVLAKLLAKKNSSEEA